MLGPFCITDSWIPFPTALVLTTAAIFTEERRLGPRGLQRVRLRHRPGGQRLWGLPVVQRGELRGRDSELSFFESDGGAEVLRAFFGND